MRRLGDSGRGAATSRELEVRPGPATGPQAALSLASTPRPAAGSHIPPPTGPQGLFLPRSAMFVAHRRPRPANQTHPFRQHLLRAVQSESQWRARARPMLRAEGACGPGTGSWGRAPGGGRGSSQAWVSKDARYPVLS